MNESMLAAVAEAAKDKTPAGATAAGLTAARAEGHAEGRAAGLVEGAKVERERILGIQGAAFAGQEALAGELIADGKTTAPEAALKFNAALKARGPDHVAQLRSMDKQVRVPANAAGGAADKPAGAIAQTEAGWKAEFAASAELQAEFTGEGAYVAFKKGSAAGKLRILQAPDKAA